MNKKGISAYAVAIFILLGIVGFFAYTIIEQPNFADVIDSAKEFWDSAKWIVYSILAFLFLWNIKFFKLFGGK